MQMVHIYVHVTWLHAWEGRPVQMHGQCHLYSNNAAVIPTYLYITEFDFLFVDWCLQGMECVLISE